jgi:hypothetical protein
LKKQKPIPFWISILAAVAMGAALVAIAAPRMAYLLASPLWLASLALSILAGFALVFPNMAGIRLLAVLKWTGYGAAATLLAFSLQSVLNGSLVRLLGADSITHPIPALILGAGAALCQTLGKYAAIRIGSLGFGFRSEPSLCLSIGLGVGLGFGICETFLLATQQILTGVPVESLIGVLERSSANGFHIYSAGLIAAGLALRSTMPIALVIAIHTAMDGFSTAFGHRVSLLVSEGVFLLFAIVTWGCWIVASKRVPNANPQR